MTSPKQPAVHRATLLEVGQAFELVKEYYEEVGVVAREDLAEFQQQYFNEGTGVWRAIVESATVGCVALRRLAAPPNCGEIKRMYVRSSHRGKGIAELLLAALEQYAENFGYEWLYLDTTDAMIAATRFYERNSYQRCERYNDNPQATIFMRKRIAAIR
jgi:GNAT superfamily N-acetyltransferase